MKISKKLSLLLAVGLLLAPLGLHFAARNLDAEKVALPGGKALAELLPKTLSGFGVHDEPIAATDEMKRAVGELLNFSDAAYRIYQAPGRRVSVYVAWWETGRMSPRLVAAHTPDVCWPVVGWTRAPDREKNLGGLGLALAQEAFAPAEMRVFVASEKPEYVVFWHRVGDRLLSYNTGWAPPWWAWLDELWRDGLAGRKSQLFVRISSDVPLETLWRDPALEPLRTALLELGLGVPLTK